MTKILVIEDEEVIRSTIADTLSFEGYTVLEADNGLKGLHIAQNQLPDLIISDVLMPELDGYSLLLKLRSIPATSTIPFILLTAQLDRTSMRRGMEMGADDFLTKPFTPGDLLNAVISRLEKHALFIKEYDDKLDSLRGHLISTLPHEMRTPLTGILGYSEFIMLDGDTLDRPKIIEMATDIHQAGQRLRRLIENYLLYANIEITRYDAARVQLMRGDKDENPAETIRTAATECAAAAKRESDLQLDLPSQIATPARISHDNLSKIVDELVDNALKFSRAGTPVIVRVKQEEGQYILSVQDSGHGMTPQQIKSIAAVLQFDRKLYEQQGTGLGLLIARRLAELYGGDLRVESVPGESTTVYVTLLMA